MSFPAYRSYRDSGVEWLGEVPSHWNATRLKRAADIYPSNVDKKSAEGQDPVRLCNYTDVYYNDVIEPTLPFMDATATTEQIDKFSLRGGDTIITKDSETANDIARSAYVSQTLPGVVCGYHLSIVRSKACASGAFLKRYFDSAAARGYFHVSANGLTRVGLGQYVLDNAPIALPPLDEQVAIAAFLDRETAKIDALIEEQRRLIALLKEKRQAVISHAVTKGLDPHAPMKDSGIEWLGEVPAHWQVLPFKRLIEATNAGEVIDRTHWGGAAETLYTCALEPMASDYPSFPEWKRTTLRDLLLTRNGTPYVHKPIPNAIYTNVVQRVTLWKKLNRDFFALAAQMSAHNLRGYGVSIESLNYEMWKELPIPIPSDAEQSEIVDHIVQCTCRLHTLGAEAQASKLLFEERRAALISAAVTGKIDVRGSVAAEQDREAA